MVDLAIVLMIWGISGLWCYNWFEKNWLKRADEVLDIKIEKPLLLKDVVLPGSEAVTPPLSLGCGTIAMGPLLLVLIWSSRKSKSSGS